MIAERVHTATIAWREELEGRIANLEAEHQAEVRELYRVRHEPPFVFLEFNARAPVMGIIPREWFFAEKDVPKRVRQTVNNLKPSLPIACTCVVVFYHPRKRTIDVAAIDVAAVN